MRKKILAIVMSLTMILVFMPAMAFAEGSEKEVVSIDFIPEEPMIVDDYYLKDECELTEVGYLYDPGSCLIEGDSISITFKDDTTAVYKLTEGDNGALWVNENDTDDVILMEDIIFSPAYIPESAADNDSFNFEIEYLNVKTLGSVVLKKSNISKITYTPKTNAVTLYKGVDDDGTYFDVINAYDYLYGFGKDKVMIEYNDGTPTETLALDEFENWDYVTEKNGEYISLGEAQEATPWAAGNTYDIFLKFKGIIDTTNKITVKIEDSSYKAFSFTQSGKYLYVFEEDGLDYDSTTDEYVLNDADTVDYYGSDGDTLDFTLDDGSEVKFEYGKIEGDPDYPHGWFGFVTTDASGNKSRPQRPIMFKDNELRWKKDSNGYYINNTAQLTYMGAVSDEPLVSYVGNQMWFDPNGGEGRANFAVPIGMSVYDMPGDIMNIFQPSRSGYTFSGWYEKDPQTCKLKSEPFDFHTKIYKETFLYAKWKEATGCEHNYVTTITKASFGKKGRILVSCSKCGAVKSSTLIPAAVPKLSKTSFTYNGKVQTPTVSIAGLKSGTDYTVSWSKDRKNVGTYTATITLKGSKYAGTKKLTYTIQPKGTSIKNPAKAKKAITVKWAKQSAKMSKATITGYQIQYSTNSKFTSENKTVTVNGFKKTSKKIKKLKAKTMYYVRVRTYMKTGGKTYYSGWSKTKSVKTK